jgi:hypothetical protein
MDAERRQHKTKVERLAQRSASRILLHLPARVPNVSGPLPIEPNTSGAVYPPRHTTCFAPAWAIVSYQNFKISKTDYLVLRNNTSTMSKGSAPLPRRATAHVRSDGVIGSTCGAKTPAYSDPSSDTSIPITRLPKPRHQEESVDRGRQCDLLVLTSCRSGFPHATAASGRT